MADLKFSCPECGQHISCDGQWSDHPIQCPACQKTITVPQAHSAPPPVSPGPPTLVPQPPISSRTKLSAGLTQVARSTPVAGVPQKRSVARPPRTSNPALKYAAIAVVLVAVGGAAFVYLPGLLNQVQEIGTSKTPAPATTTGGGGVGPMGEVNGAMDVSDALDGGGSASKPRAVAPRQPPAKLGTNPAAQSAKSPPRAR